LHIQFVNKWIIPSVLSVVLLFVELHGTNYVKQRDMHTPDLLVPKPGS